MVFWVHEFCDLRSSVIIGLDDLIVQLTNISCFHKPLEPFFDSLLIVIVERPMSFVFDCLRILDGLLWCRVDGLNLLLHFNLSCNRFVRFVDANRRIGEQVLP